MDSVNQSYYTMDGDGNTHPATLLEWGEYFEKADRMICWALVDGGYVSTVFLGLDHNILESGPLLFETMIFKDAKQKNNPLEKCDYDYCRYATLEKAQKGHKRIVDALNAGEYKDHDND